MFSRTLCHSDSLTEVSLDGNFSLSRQSFTRKNFTRMAIFHSEGFHSEEFHSDGNIPLGRISLDGNISLGRIVSGLLDRSFTRMETFHSVIKPSFG